MRMNSFKKTLSGIIGLLVMILSGYIIAADNEGYSEKILSPSAWKQKENGIKLSSENEVLSCAWKGTVSGEISAKDVFDVSEIKTLEFGIEWKSKKWDFGSAFYPVLRFEDAEGKKIDTVSAFSQTKGGGNYASPPAGEFFSGTPADKWILYRNMMKVPDGAVRCRIGLLFSGNPLDCLIKKLYVKDAGTVEGPKFKKPQYDHNAKALTKEEIDKILEKRERASGKIQRKGDQNQMIVNGKVINPFIYKNGPTGGSATSQLARCKTFSDAGFTIFTISIQLGQPSYPKHRCGVWLGEGQYDIKKIEEAVYDILAYAPDAYVFLELGMTPYYEWTVNNPDEIYTNSIGEKGIMKSCRVKQYSTTPPTKDETVFWQPSYFSEKYKDDMTKAISDIFKEFEKTQASKAVLGAYLNGGADGQWLDIFEGNIINGKHEVADYSPGALKSFQKYLRKKYSNDIEKLRAEWKKNDVTFETVKMPAADDIWEKKLSHGINQATWQSDFNEWMAVANTERHITWCKAIKAASGGRMLLGAYWPEGGLAGYPIPAHRYSKGIYESDSVDFLSVVLLYGIVRQPAQYPKLYTYNGSMLLHEKLLVVELDLRNDEIPNWGYWGNKFYLETHNAKTFSSIVQRCVGYSMGLGGTFHAYDMDGGWWDTPNAVESWKSALKIAANAQPQSWDSNRIAVFVDERTADHLSLDADHRIFAYSLKEHISEALWRSGVGFDYYILEDSLDPKFTAPKVMMFADASTMKPEDAEKIRKKYGNNGRVIVWHWAPGIFAKGDITNPSKITGFKLTMEQAALEKQIFVSEEKDALTKGVYGVINPIPFFGVKLGPSWKVDDPDAKILANYNGTNIPAMAVKRYADHTEIYIGQPGGLTPRLVRNIATEAGITPYLDSDKDISRLGAGLLTVSAMDSGEKTISLPEKGKFKIKSLTGQSLESTGNVFKYFQNAYETAIFSVLRVENISNTKGVFTLKSGDYTVDVSQECKYTIASIKWKDYKILPVSGYNGTVLVYPSGMVGCGHSEGGLLEEIKSFSISADGVDLKPEPGKTYTAQKFVMKKVSMLANLQLTSEIEINGTEIKDIRDIQALDEQKITNLYIFMFCFSNKFKDWYAKELDGKAVEGTFTDSEKFLMNTDVKWAAMFDPAEGKGVGFVYPQSAIGKDKKTTFWDRKVYHKFYLFLDVPTKVEKGFSTGLKTVIVRSFDAEKANWKSIAESILSK